MALWWPIQTYPLVMSVYLYTVEARFPDDKVRQSYLDWLTGGHVQAVIQAGALSGRVISIDDPPGLRIQTQYEFANKAAFDSYVRESAPALRAEGQRLFPPASCVTFERRAGAVVFAGNAV